MAINVWTKPAEFTYTPLPFEAIAAAGAAKQKRYDEGEKSLSELEENFLKIKSLPADHLNTQEAVNAYQTEIYNIVDNYSNDLGAALPKIKELQRKLNKDLSTGYLGGVVGRYNEYVERDKQLTKLTEDYVKTGKGLSPGDKDKLLNYELNSLNAKPISKTASGQWERYKSFETKATLNYDAKAVEKAKDLKPEKIASLIGLQPVKDINGNITGYMKHGKIVKTKLTPQDIEQATNQMMLLDPEVTSYRDWEATISGKRDKMLNVLTQNPEGIPMSTPQGDVMMNPNTWADSILNEPIYNAGRSSGIRFAQNEYDISMSYMDDWRAKADYDKDRSKAYGIAAQAPALETPGTTVNLDFFNLVPAGSNVPLTPEEAKTVEAIYGSRTTGFGFNTQDIINRGRLTKDDGYNDFNSLTNSQKIQIIPYLNTLKYDPKYKEAAERIQSGTATKDDQALVYPAVQKLMAQNKPGRMNSNVVSIANDEREQATANAMFSSSKDAVITVKDLGTGFAGNANVTDSQGNVIPYKDFVAKMKKEVDPASPITIGGKTNGVNAYTNLLGDPSYGDAYQFFIEGKPYMLHNYRFDTSTEIGKQRESERVRNNYVAEFGMAINSPRGTLQSYYFGVPVEYTYIPDSQNPNEGKYVLLGFGADASGNIQKDLPSNVQREYYGSADLFERGLSNILTTTLKK